jgi:hypothetical protein
MWMYEQSPIKAYQDVQSLGENRWIRMFSPELSQHSRSVAQGVIYTASSAGLCVVATRFPALRKLCVHLQKRLSMAQYQHHPVGPHAHTNSTAMITDPFSTPPRSRRRLAICDTPSPLPSFDQRDQSIITRIPDTARASGNGTRYEKRIVYQAVDDGRLAIRD